MCETWVYERSVRTPRDLYSSMLEKRMAEPPLALEAAEPAAGAPVAAPAAAPSPEPSAEAPYPPAPPPSAVPSGAAAGGPCTLLLPVVLVMALLLLH